MLALPQHKVLLSRLEGVEWLIDIGVDTGREAWEFKEKFPAINIVGVDPTPKNNPDWRNYPGEIVVAACSSFTGNLTMYREPAGGDGGGTFLIASKTPDCLGEVTMPCFKVDTLWLSRDFNNAVLWLDVEGHEYAILQGAEKLLKAGKVSYVYCEVRSKSPYATTPDWCTHKPVFNILFKHEFEIVDTYNYHLDYTMDTNEEYFTADVLLKRRLQ